MESKIPKDFVDLHRSTWEEKKIVNVIGVVTDFMPAKPTAGGTDWMLTFSLNDGSWVHGNYNKGQKVRLFAKERELPSLNGPGDVVLLRKVKCISFAGQMLLSSNYEHTTWTVFHAPIPKDLGPFGGSLKHSRARRAPMPTVPEMEYVISLACKQDQSVFSAPLSQEDKTRLTQRDKFSLIKDIEINRLSHLVGEVVKVFTKYERAQLYITDYTENNLLHSYGQKDDEAGLSSQESRQWPGPPGKYTLLIECFPPHSYHIRENISVGDFVHIRNVHVKQNRDHGVFKIEGVLHGERGGNEDRINVKVLSNKKDDRILNLLSRKEALGFIHRAESNEPDSAADSKKRKAEDEPKNTKLSKRQQRKKKQKEQEKAQALKDRENSTSKPPQNSISKPELPKPTNALPSNQQITVHNALKTLNTNIRCTHADRPERSVSQILDTSEAHHGEISDGNPSTLEHVDLTSVTTVRVVDFKPAHIEDFAVQRPRRASDASRAPSDNESPEPPSSSDEADSDAESIHSAASLLRKSTQAKKSKWEWQFALLLEDARPEAPRCGKGEGDRIVVFVKGSDAEFLLNMRAKDLRRNPRSLAQLREKMFILWGDLEERKAKEEKEREATKRRALAEREANGGGKAKEKADKEKEKVEETFVPSTRPFKCCLKEYGTQVAETTWERKFALCWTTIKLGDEPPAPAEANEKQTFRAPRAG